MLEASPGATKKICLDLQRSRRFQKCLGKQLCMRHRTVATVAAQLRAPLCPARIDDPSTIRRQVSMDLHYDDVTTRYDVLRTTCYEYHPGVPPHLPFLRFLRLLVPGQLLQQTDASLQPLQLPEKDRELITLITSITSNVANQSGCQK